MSCYQKIHTRTLPLSLQESISSSSSCLLNSIFMLSVSFYCFFTLFHLSYINFPSFSLTFSSFLDFFIHFIFSHYFAMKSSIFIYVVKGEDDMKSEQSTNITSTKSQIKELNKINQDCEKIFIHFSLLFVESKNEKKERLRSKLCNIEIEKVYWWSLEFLFVVCLEFCLFIHNFLLSWNTLLEIPKLNSILILTNNNESCLNVIIIFKIDHVVNFETIENLQTILEI